MADKVNVDNLVFETVGEKSASVAAVNEDISGDIVIPETVEISGKKYTVTTIADGGFRWCSKITSVTLPNTLKFINYDGFYRCSGLKEIFIPKNVTSINGWAFYGCINIEKFEVEEGNKYYKDVDGCLLSADGLYFYLYPFGKTEETYSVPEGVEDIATSVSFQNNTKLKSVKLPSTLKYICFDAFSYCSALEEIDLPGSIIDIGGGAFYDCESLKTVIIRSGNPLWLVSKTLFSDYTYEKATLHVPQGRSEYYKAAPIWGDFKTIEEVEMPDITIDPSPFGNITMNQMRVGYCLENSCYTPSLKDHEAYGGKKAGTYKAFLRFTDIQMNPFVGNHITHARFSLWDDKIKNVKFFISSSIDGDYLYSQAVDKLAIGWNEVTLDTPFEINGDTIYIGYEYQQTGSCYPVATANIDWQPGVFYLTGPFGGNGEITCESINDWALRLQLIVEGDNIPENDISMTWIKSNQIYCKPNTQFEGMFQCVTWGRKNVNKYEYAYLLDDVEIYSNTRNYSPGDCNLFFDIPADVSNGEHTLKVAIKSINGEKPLYTADDTLSIPLRVYREDIGRHKILIVNHTATWCPYSVSRNTVISNLMSKRDDIALLKVHDNDGLSCETGDIYSQFIYILPIVKYDYYFSEITDAEKCPAFATIDIQATYNKNSRKLDITLTGQRNEDYLLFAEDAKLTVLLTEDDIVMPQYNSETDKYDYNYKHKGILRKNVSDVWGDDILWSDNKYEKQYSINLNNDWESNNMKIVAFIVSPFDGKNYLNRIVINANDFAVKDAKEGTGINEINNERQMDIYTIQGNKIRSNTSDYIGLKPGVYIVNGKKIIIN